MLRIAGTIALLLLSVTISAADKVVSYEELGMSISYPESWEVSDEFQDGVLAQGASPLADGAKQNAYVIVSTRIVKAGTSLNEHVDKNLDGKKDRFINYELIESSEVNIGSIKAYKVVWYHDGPKTKIRLKMVDYFVINDGQASDIYGRRQVRL